MIDEPNWDKVSGLLPAIIQDEEGSVLMLGVMNQEALKKTIDEGLVTFYSRTKGRLWTKGETSGQFLKVKTYCLDCDKDTLLITVAPLKQGAVCHLGTPSCFEKGFLPFLQKLSNVIDQRMANGAEGSYVHSLSKKGAARIAQKVGEEGVEVAIASVKGDRSEIIEESADLLFHLLVNLRYHNITFNEVLDTLKSRVDISIQNYV